MTSPHDGFKFDVDFVSVITCGVTGDFPHKVDAERSFTVGVPAASIRFEMGRETVDREEKRIVRKELPRRIDAPIDRSCTDHSIFAIH